MKARLNVTEAERRCYSRRRLQVISALRAAGIDPSVYGLHKDYRVPGVPQKIYLVQHPGGRLYYFPTLKAIQVYASEEQEWKAHPPRSWWAFAALPAKEPPARAGCSWPQCKLEAAGLVERQPYCRAHGYIYQQMLVASGKKAPSASGIPA